MGREQRPWHGEVRQESSWFFGVLGPNAAVTSLGNPLLTGDGTCISDNSVT